MSFFFFFGRKFQFMVFTPDDSSLSSDQDSRHQSSETLLTEPIGTHKHLISYLGFVQVWSNIIFELSWIDRIKNYITLSDSKK